MGSRLSKYLKDKNKDQSSITEKKSASSTSKLSQYLNEKNSTQPTRGAAEVAPPVSDMNFSKIERTRGMDELPDNKTNANDDKPWHMAIPAGLSEEDATLWQRIYAPINSATSGAVEHFANALRPFNEVHDDIRKKSSDKVVNLLESIPKSDNRPDNALTRAADKAVANQIAREGTHDYDHPVEDKLRDLAESGHEASMSVGGDVSDFINETAFSLGNMVPSMIAGQAMTNAVPQLGAAAMMDDTAIMANEMSKKLVRLLPMGWSKAGGELKGLEGQDVDIPSKYSYAASTGVNEAMTELLPFDLMGDAFKAVKTTGLLKTGAKAFAGWAAGTLAEGAQEGIVGPMDNLAYKIYVDPTAEIFNLGQMGRDAAGGIALGLMISAFGLPGSAVSYRAQRMASGEENFSAKVLNDGIKEATKGQVDAVEEMKAMTEATPTLTPEQEQQRQMEEAKATEAARNMRLLNDPNINASEEDVALFNRIMGSAIENPGFVATDQAKAKGEKNLVDKGKTGSLKMKLPQITKPQTEEVMADMPRDRFKQNLEELRTLEGQVFNEDVNTRYSRLALENQEIFQKEIQDNDSFTMSMENESGKAKHVVVRPSTENDGKTQITFFEEGGKTSEEIVSSKAQIADRLLSQGFTDLDTLDTSITEEDFQMTSDQETVKSPEAKKPKSMPRITASIADRAKAVTEQLHESVAGKKTKAIEELTEEADFIAKAKEILETTTESNAVKKALEMQALKDKAGLMKMNLQFFAAAKESIKDLQQVKGVDQTMLKKHLKAIEDFEKKGITKATIKEYKRLVDAERTVKKLRKTHDEALKEVRRKHRNQIEAVKKKGEEKLQDYKDKKKEDLNRRKDKRDLSNRKTKLLKQIDKLEKNMKKMKPHYKEALEEVLLNLDSDYHEYLSKVVDQYDTKAKSMRKSNRVKLEKTFDYFERVKADYKAETGSDYVMNPDIEAKLERLDKRQLNDLTEAEFVALEDIVNHIVHLNETATTLSANKMVRTKNEVVNDTVKSIGAAQKEFYDDAPETNIGKMVQLGKGTFGIDSLTPDGIAKKITGYDTDSTFYKMIFEPLVEGQRKMLQFKQRSHEYFEKAMTDSKLDIKTLTGRKAERREYKVKAGRIQMNAAEEISFYLHTKNKDNIDHIVHGGIRTISRGNNMVNTIQMTHEEIGNIVSQIDPKYKKLADEFFQFFQTVQKDAINETSVALDGYEIATTKNYFPIVTDGQYRDKSMPKIMHSASIENRGFLKDREAGKNPIVLEDVFNVIERSQEQISTYYGMAVPLRNAKVIIGNSQVRSALKSKFGSNKIYNYFQKLFSYIEEGSAKVQKADAEKISMQIFRNTQKAILGANPSIWFNQPASFLTASARIDTKYLIKGAKKKANYELMQKHSPVVWLRMQGYVTREAGDIAKQKSEFDKKTDIFTMPIQKFDSMTIGRIWNAVEYELVDKGNYEKGSDEFYEAVARRTESIIYETQPNYTIMQRPQLLREESVHMKLMTSFMTQRMQNYNLMYEAVVALKTKGDKEQIIRVTAAMISTSLYIATVKSLKAMWRGYDNDFFEEFLGSQLSNAPFIGDVANFLIGGWEIERLDTSTVNDLLKAVNDVVSPGKRTTFGVIYGLAEALAPILGIPMKNVRKELETILKKTSPMAHYQYLKAYKKPTRTDMYSAMEEAIRNNDKEFIKYMISELKKDGATASGVGNSFRNRDVDTYMVEFVKRQLGD